MKINLNAFVVFISIFYIIKFMTVKLQVILRGFFVLLMLSTSLGKLLDNRGFAEVIQTYHLLPVLPEIFMLALALAFSVFELGLGIVLTRPNYLRPCGLALIGLHFMYTSLAVITLLRGIHIQNCGCFGVFWARPMTWGTVVEDLILLALSVLFYTITPRERAKHV